jgi:starch-binding outer membrane protein, SusD/RagB family
MKKLFILSIVLFTSLFFVSCKKSFLDEKSLSAYSPENTLRDSLGFEANIAGLQAAVREQYTAKRPVDVQMTGFQVGTDVCIVGKGNANAAFENYALLNPQNAIISFYWYWAYKVISNANQIIHAAEDPTVQLSIAARNGFLGEAKFYRAYAYNFLTTLFGPVPLLDAPINEPRTDFTNTQVQTLNDFVIKDLVFSKDNLPGIDAVKKAGRISKEAAQQLLAEVYLRDNKPALAEAECLKVISGPFSLVKNRYGVQKSQSGDAFSDMFIYGNQRRREGNTEAIWVVEQEFGVPGGSTDGDQHRRNWVPTYFEKTGMVICDSLGGRGQGNVRLSWWVINKLYNGNDMRNSKYNLHRDFWFNDPANSKFGQKIIAAPADTLYRLAPYTTKWNFTLPTDVLVSSTYKDLIIMRLGETYLLLAEAQFKQGKLTEAAASINMIRSRAQATLVQPSDVTLDFILDERTRELIGEENRRMTLVRTGTLIDRIKRLNYVTNSNVQDFNILLPIPQSEIDLNKDGDLEQNPGYN